jgi:hypothetical protein
MLDDEEMLIFTTFENDQLIRSVNADEEIAFARQAAKDYLSKLEYASIDQNHGRVFK